MSNLDKHKASFTLVALLLAILLGIRAFSHIEVIGNQSLIEPFIILLIAALFGVITRKEYGGLVAMVGAAIEIVVRLITSSGDLMVIIIYDLVIIFLGYKDMRAIEEHNAFLTYQISSRYSGEQTSKVKVVLAENQILQSRSQTAEVIEQPSQFCSSCGDKLNSNAKLCDNCGESVI
ncbi:MAG: zinc ribbon domain-containing protein [Candidatus Kariarchaeaceae archaeon]